MIDRCYLEITNVCNLDCIFCPKTKRQKRLMSPDEFEAITDRIQGQVRFLYFHLMGEPMLHPHLDDFIRSARDKGFIPVLTTNGTLISKGLKNLPHKIQISLHSHEGNQTGNSLSDYLRCIMTFAVDAAAHGTIVVLRLWNQGGYDRQNDEILNILSDFVPSESWIQRYDGWKLADHLYLEYDQMFEWPDEAHALTGEDEVFCYALRNQIGILADGTVVPCCLDHDGSIPLGNIFSQTLDGILSGQMARQLYDGFSRHTAVAPLCQRCDYAAVTKRFRKK
ncbi:MAG: radical SAM protein [Bacteroidales bacterium]|nr:radical SAM protein [Candidatus Liminaster caballi]